MTSATYGSLDGLSTGLLYSYDGGKSWTSAAPDWDYGFAGSLAAGSIDTAAQAGTFDVPATQNSGSFSVNGATHEGFYSRDYEVAYSTAYRLSVTKRHLVVTFNDAWGVYGGAIPSIGWSYDQNAQPEDGGLAAFDTKDTVFQENPVLAIDASVTASADFASIPVRYAGNGDVAAYEGAVSAQGGVSANYEVEFVKGNLTIFPEKLSDTGRIVMTGGSDYTYDGSAHGPSGYVVSDAGNELLAGKDYKLSADEDTTNAGTVTVTFAGMGNYSGTVTATYVIAPAELTVKTPSASKTYDGAALTEDDGTTLEGLVAGETATAKATGSLTDAGVADNTYEIAWGTAKESNYKVHQELGTLEVLPRTLTVGTYSARKQYDGEPLTAGGSMQGLVKGETATLKTTGSQTEVGSNENTFEIAWGSAKASNYTVEQYLGTLTVEPNTAAITLTAPSGTKRYNGTPLAAIGYKVSGLPRGFVVRAEVAGSQTDVGSSESTIASYAIIDAAGNDVTSHFPNVTKVAGVLKVTEREDLATNQVPSSTSDSTGGGTSDTSGTSDAPGTPGEARMAGNTSAGQASSSVPNTGDAAAAGAAVTVLGAGAAALVVAYLLRRRRSWHAAVRLTWSPAHARRAPSYSLPEAPGNGSPLVGLILRDDVQAFRLRYLALENGGSPCETSLIHGACRARREGKPIMERQDNTRKSLPNGSGGTSGRWMRGAFAAVLAGSLVLGGGATAALAEGGASIPSGGSSTPSTGSATSLSEALLGELLPDTTTTAFSQDLTTAQVKEAALSAHESTAAAKLASMKLQEVSKELSDGASVNLTSDASDASVLNVYNIKHGGTYTFTGSASNVQIKVDASSSEEVYLWLNDAHIDNRHLSDDQNDVAPIAVTDDSHVTFRGDPASEKSSFIGPYAAAGIEVQGSAQATFADGAYIEAFGGGDANGASAGIGGSSNGKKVSDSESDSGTLVFKDGCDATGRGDGFTDSYEYWDEKAREMKTYNYGLAGAGIGSAADGHAHAIIILGGKVQGYAPAWAAGIGAGTPWNSGNGGNVDSIQISGGTVTAAGGDYAPGIGAPGGTENWIAGQVGDITIDGGDVTAYGGRCAAGIGTGKYADVRGDITISGGTVHTGNIGAYYYDGNSNDGELDGEILIDGGYISAGTIGTGKATGDARIAITGGTVLATGINPLSDKDAGKVRILGGSVKAKVDTARGYCGNSENVGPNVYRVELVIPDGANKKAKVYVQADGITQYFTNDIQTDENGYLYFYLPVQDGKENTADITVDGTTYHYRDNYTTKSDGSGWMKMDAGVVQFKGGPIYLTADGTASVALDDASNQWNGATWKFTVDGAATLVDGSNTSSSGAYANVKGKSGAKYGDTYAVTATMEGESLSYWSATGTSGELPIYNAPDIRVSDLSKTFDGVPITTNDALKSVTTPSNGAVHVQLQEYSQWRENYGWNDVDQALLAGNYSNDPSGELYRVVVTTDATSAYAPGSYAREFHIYKRPTTTSIASIDAVVSNGTLSGWNITAQVSGFVSGYTGGSVTLYDTTNGANTGLVSADVPDGGKLTLFVDAAAIADPSACVIKASYGGDAYYYSGSEKSFATLPALPTISVPDLTKTYDGVAITAATARPQISTNAESGVTVRIQQQAGDGWQDVSSAENAGHYRALAETQASAAYVAGSASQEFDILEAPTATSVSGVSETSGGVVTGWTVTAKVAGLVPGHAAGAVTFYSTASGTDVQLGSPVSVSADGTASATISADGVESGAHTIKAVYSGAANYAGSEGSLTASLSLRGISGTASYEKAVGNAAFKLDMATGMPTPTDKWSYRVAEDSYAAFVREDGSKAESTVTVSDDGQVSVKHAGTALIEVTLSDTSGTYADQTVYVTVTVG